MIALVKKGAQGPPRPRPRPRLRVWGGGPHPPRPPQAPFGAQGGPAACSTPLKTVTISRASLYEQSAGKKAPHRCDMGAPAPPPATAKRTSGIPTGPVLVGLLETSAVDAQQLIKSTRCTWMGVGPGAGRVGNDRLWPYHALSYSAFDPSRRPKPNYHLTTPSCIVVEL